MQDEGLDAVEPAVDELRDVPVTAELAQEGLGVPQDVERLLGPGKSGMAGEQRPALGVPGCCLGRPSGQFGGGGHLR